MDFKKINWTVLIKRYTSPQAVKDFDEFLDGLPIAVGYNALIAACFAWLVAGTAIFFTSTETQKVTKQHAELLQIQALQPPIPVLQYIPISAETLKTVGEKVVTTYKGVQIVTSAGIVTVTAQDTDYFPQFLSAISYLQRGGKNWKVKIDNMCVGRDCIGAKLSVRLKMETVRFGEPEVKKP